MTRVTVIDTGCANLASVAAAFRRLGVDSAVTISASAVRDAAHVVLPGVGAFEPAMRRLAESGMADALRARVASARPLLAICLGLQLLADGSDEAPGVEGLGVVSGKAQRFGAQVRVPQLGWNLVSSTAPAGLVRDGFAYFANSYCLAAAAPEWSSATAEYGAPFVASLERDSLLACQFHPELSGSWGAQLIERWYTSC